MSEFISCHVEGVLACAVATVVNLDVFKSQRTRVGVSAEDAVCRTIMNDRIANCDVVRVMVNTAKAAARYMEAFNNEVNGQTEFHCLGPSVSNRRQAIH